MMKTTFYSRKKHDSFIKEALVLVVFVLNLTGIIWGAEPNPKEYFFDKLPSATGPLSISVKTSLAEAAKSGNPLAQCELACAYSFFGEDDLPYEAEFWFKKAGEKAPVLIEEAKKGNRNIQLGLFYIFQHGFGVGSDQTEAWMWLEEAAKNGQTDAQLLLGNFLADELADAEHKNPEKGCFWLDLAAKNGHAHAMFCLAIHYIDGTGGGKNLEKAQNLLQISAKLGHKVAAEMLINEKLFAGKESKTTSKIPIIQATKSQGTSNDSFESSKATRAGELMDIITKRENDWFSSAKALIEKNPGVSFIKKEDGDTPLHSLCVVFKKDSFDSTGDFIYDENFDRAGAELIPILIKHGANIDAQNNDGETPLHCAGLCHAPIIGKALIDHGANLKLVDKDGITPLLRAMISGSPEIAKMIVLQDHSCIYDKNQTAFPTPLKIDLLYSHIQDLSFIKNQPMPQSPLEMALLYAHMPEIISHVDTKYREYRELINLIYQIEAEKQKKETAIQGEKSRVDLSKLIKSDPVYFAQEEKVSSFEQITKSIENNPEYADGYFLLGSWYMFFGEPGEAAQEKALPLYLKAVDLNPYDLKTLRELYLLLGLKMLRLANSNSKFGNSIKVLEEAIFCLSQQVALDNDDLSSLYLLGVFRAARGDKSSMRAAMIYYKYLKERNYWEADKLFEKISMN